LESFHGKQKAHWPTDPYQFLVWWHCGYPASEERCAKGWEAVRAEIGTAPRELLAAPSEKLSRALRPGGMIPELRAGRLKQIARSVLEQTRADLKRALTELPLAEVRRRLKKFPGIADPGADRILLFGGISPIAAVPSSCPQVLVRIASGHEPESYNASYREAQQIIEKQVANTFKARERAYLLVLSHGQHLCKRSKPRCDQCPVSRSCAFFAGIRD
jgi:endonuclease III